MEFTRQELVEYFGTNLVPPYPEELKRENEEYNRYLLIQGMNETIEDRIYEQLNVKEKSRINKM